YYYEVVKVGDTYVLDRDLGAASNKFYTKGASQYRNNTAAIGGYFKVNAARWSDYKKDTETQNRREDQQTITSRLNLVAHTPSKGRFVMATENDVLGWNINTDGTSVSARTVAGRVADNTIYFPKIGYYEGDELKNDMHTNFWTRTYLGGTQGLGVESDEYGYWYRYYDDMKSTNPENRFSNISMARGAGVSGKSPDNNSVWRYMPLRLVWVDNDCINPQGSAEVDNTVTGKMIVYLNTTSTPWQTVRYHYWNFANGAGSNFGTRPDMEKVGENLWRAELPVPTANSGLLFSNGFDDPGNPGQTLDINSLYNEYQTGNTVLYFRTTTQISDENNNNYQKWRVELYKRSSEDNNNVTPPTPAERETVTIMLKNDAVWQSATVNIYAVSDIVLSKPMAKVRYNGEQYFQIDLDCIDNEKLLNTNGSISFQYNIDLGGGSGSGKYNYRTQKFSQVSTYHEVTDKVFFFSNKNASNSTLAGGEYIGKASSVNYIDGWLTTSTTERIRLKGTFNNLNWGSLNDEFTYDSSIGKYKLTVNVTSAGEFVFEYYENNGWSDHYKNDKGQNSNVEYNTDMTIRNTGDNDNNWIFYETGTFTLYVELNADDKPAKLRIEKN
ncbi:MAG: hypothetical protein K2M62_01630, partial [Muribaculaceae bacterium]|nr:hypothetical protein [Muribaculaceae bacterium]